MTAGDAVPHPEARRPSLGRRLLRRVPLLGAAVGVVLALWLVAANDVGAVADAFGRVGVLGIVAVVLVRVVIVGLCGIAWARVLSGLVGLASGPFVLLRFVREQSAAGRADLCAVGRPHLANPAWTLSEAARIGWHGVAWPRQYLAGKAQLERNLERERLQAAAPDH